MNPTTFRAIAAISFLSFNIIFVTTIILTNQGQQTAQATGGGAEVAELLNPLVDRTIQAIQNNNTDLALEELETIKQELKDTFELEDDD